MWTLELELHGHWYRVAALGELGCTVGPVLSLWAAGLECGTAAADCWLLVPAPSLER